MKLLIIDGNSLINRAFYGIRILSTAGGEYTNAVYGFLSTYFKLYEEESPDGVCVCFDLKAPTFRHLEYSEYKAGRRPMPEELVSQIPLLKEVLDTMGISRCELAGYEADDLLGTIARLCREHGDEAVIVTGDRDSLQLSDVNTRVKLVTSREGKTITTDYTPATILETYGVSPKSLIQVKALMGDKSDNIPGVAGIGEKTALDLIRKYETVQKLYDELDGADIRASVKEKLLRDRDNAFMSLHLAEIDCFAPIEYCDTCMALRPADENSLYRLFTRLEFRAFIKKLDLKPSAQTADTVKSCGDSRDFSVIPVTSDEDAENLCAKISASKEVSFLLGDGEEYLSVSLNDGDKDSIYILINGEASQSAWNDTVTALAMSDGLKICHNAKGVYSLWIQRGIAYKNIGFDTAVAAYLIDPAASAYEIYALANRYLGEELPEPIHLSDGAFSPLGDREIALQSLALYTHTLSRLKSALSQLLAEQGMDKLFREVELPLSEVLASMEHDGITVDTSALTAYSAQLTVEINALEKTIYSLADMQFNINSPKQLGELLFEKLALPHKKKTKSGYSTDIDTLNAIRTYHPIIDAIIEYRSLTKLRSTYADGLMKFISPVDSRIHSNFQQLVTATGRISSTDPNLQNIPVRTQRGAELRRMFVAREGYTLVDADYSQIELRVLAHIADDKSLKDAFSSGGDIHRATAASVEGVDFDDVTPEMRSRAKAVNFGLVYGMSEFTLAENIGVTRKEAKAYIENYFSKYPGVKRYMDEIKGKAKLDGYVTTLMGRRRYLPELSSSNFNIRSFGERVALNTPIQGTAADIIKIAMVRIYERLKREKLKSRLILQVHDELIVETKKDELDKVMNLVEEEMRNAMDLSVELVADAASADNWFDAKK